MTKASSILKFILLSIIVPDILTKTLLRGFFKLANIFSRGHIVLLHFLCFFLSILNISRRMIYRFFIGCVIRFQLIFYPCWWVWCPLIFIINKSNEHETPFLHTSQILSRSWLSFRYIFTWCIVLYIRYINDANKNFKIDKSLLNKIRIIKIRWKLSILYVCHLMNSKLLKK